MGFLVIRLIPFFSMGAFFILAILHLVFYLHYASQKAHLYLFLYSSLLAVAMAVFGINFHQVKYVFFIENLKSFLVMVGSFFMYTAIHSIFRQKVDWLYKILLALILLGILLNQWKPYWGSIFNVICLLIILNLEIVRLSFKALKKKQRGAGIIAKGAIGFLVGWLILIVGLPYNFLNNHFGLPYSVGELLWTFTFLSIPVATSIYLGLDFAFTSVSLNQKLLEVEELSQKTIEQEKEKQQILAAQNETLEQLVNQRTIELQNSLYDLKRTQSQLLQKEKMASLGELTAGIAHEIQNPLNFVNNFSEVSTELVEEIKQETVANHKQEVLYIAEDLQQNLAKIQHHGKRADAIVKSMLQHSRANSGQKQPTDINALAEEYLRLSYHGLRSKNKDFNASLITEFDGSIGKVEVVPQDIGRVLLNLFNNAFYATQQKKALLNGQYQPEIKVRTGLKDGQIEIQVRDNGIGIPESVKNKIFQPFFTTKPTGQGTGLGLSLSYDIITNGHKGELKVNTKEGEFTEFVISLPQ